jgi:hypothetical protein
MLAASAAVDLDAGRTDFSAAVWEASVPKPEAIPA